MTNKRYEIATVCLDSTYNRNRETSFDIADSTDAIHLLADGYQLVAVYQADSDNYFVFQREVGT